MPEAPAYFDSEDRLVYPCKLQGTATIEELTREHDEPLISSDGHLSACYPCYYQGRWPYRNFYPMTAANYPAFAIAAIMEIVNSDPDRFSIE
jgi:hypothetical protein